MKQILRFSLILFFASCSQRPTDSAVSQGFGDKFDTLNSMTVAELTSNLTGKSKIDCIIRGRTNEVCQSEGCWFTLKNSDGGKSEAEIQMIKEPKIQPVFEAEGVFLVAENESKKK